MTEALLEEQCGVLGGERNSSLIGKDFARDTDAQAGVWDAWDDFSNVGRHDEWRMNGVYAPAASSLASLDFVWEEFQRAVLVWKERWEHEALG